jgi:hypothetical protein
MMLTLVAKRLKTQRKNRGIDTFPLCISPDGKNSELKINFSHNKRALFDELIL